MRQKIALVASIALGLITVFAMRMYLQEQKEQSKPDIKTVKVIISGTSMNKGHIVKKSDLDFLNLPAKQVSSDMLKPDELTSIIGKSVKRSINRDSILLGSDFISPNVRTATLIKQGMRLMSIPVDQVTGVSGLIKPGSKVDILWTRSIKKGGATAYDQRTLTLLSNVSVYAIDQKTSHFEISARKRRSYTAITIFVTPQEGPMLVTAQETGKLTLMLRSNRDIKIDTDIKAIQVGDIEAASRQAIQNRISRK